MKKERSPEGNGESKKGGPGGIKKLKLWKTWINPGLAKEFKLPGEWTKTKENQEDGKMATSTHACRKKTR